MRCTECGIAKSRDAFPLGPIQLELSPEEYDVLAGRLVSDRVAWLSSTEAGGPRVSLLEKVYSAAPTCRSCRRALILDGR